jgi:hypothetical protein
MNQTLPTLKVALLGCGVVGTDVARLLTEQADDLALRVGARLELAGIAVRRVGHRRSATIDRALLTADPLALATRPDVDIVVEVIGGIEPARSLLLAALKGGKPVVTANKALLAENGAEIYGAAREYGADLYYEASVAGAIPILRPLRESLAGDTVYRVLGIVNGTTNFILDRMDSSGAGFAESLEEELEHLATSTGHVLETDVEPEVWCAGDEGRIGKRTPFLQAICQKMLPGVVAHVRVERQVNFRIKHPARAQPFLEIRQLASRLSAPRGRLAGID